MQGVVCNQSASIDLTTIEQFVVHRYNWSASRTKEAVDKYRVFLAAAANQENTRKKLISDVDDVWHAHILHTEKYIADCLESFGRIIHHYPRSYENASVEKVECAPEQPCDPQPVDCSP